MSTWQRGRSPYGGVWWRSTVPWWGGLPKTERGSRTFALLPSALMAMQRQQVQQQVERQRTGWVEEGFVFAATNGHALHLSNVNRAFQRIRGRAGVRPLPVYSLRHASASILLGAGVPVAVAAKMMGHSVHVFCETYADLLVEATHEAAKQAEAWLARQQGGWQTRWQRERPWEEIPATFSFSTQL